MSKKHTYVELPIIEDGKNVDYWLNRKPVHRLKNTDRQPPKIEIIHWSRSSLAMCEIFAEGVNSDCSLETVKIIDSEEEDEHLGPEYSISLNKYTISNQLLIWGSPGIDSSVNFDGFFIVFDEGLEEVAEATLERLANLFKEKYDESVFDLLDGLDNIFLGLEKL